MAAQDEKREQVQREEYMLNRCINYIVMREMWQSIRKRAKKGSKDTIYAAFHMSRTRYNNAVNGESFYLKAEELKNLEEDMGVSQDIFAGKSVFQFDGITRKEWKEYFDLRSDKGAREARDKLEALFKRITEKDVDEKKNPDFYRFAIYLRKRSPIGDTKSERIIREGISLLKSISLSDVDGCQIETLRNYVDVIEKQADIARTVLQYKKLKMNE